MFSSEAKGQGSTYGYDPNPGKKKIPEFYFLEGTLHASISSSLFSPLQIGKLRPTEVTGLTEAYPTARWENWDPNRRDWSRGLLARQV